MKPALFVFVLVSICLVAGCSSRRALDAEESPSAPASSTDSGTVVPPEAAEPVAVIRRYYAAINAGQYREAYALWGDDGPPNGQTFEAFQAGFKETTKVEVEVGEAGRIEGAAGSRFIEIPVVVQAETRTGKAQRFEGTYTLRRVVVDGATPAQQRWHFYRGDLRQTQ